MPEVRALTANDLSCVAAMGLDQALALRAQAQDMAWVLAQGDTILGAATAQLADGTVFLDALVGDEPAKLALIDHALAYARWGCAPAVTLLEPKQAGSLEQRGFVGLDPGRLPPSLHLAANGNRVLMRRL